MTNKKYKVLLVWEVEEDVTCEITDADIAKYPELMLSADTLDELAENERIELLEWVIHEEGRFKQIECRFLTNELEECEEVKDGD